MELAGPWSVLTQPKPSLMPSKKRAVIKICNPILIQEVQGMLVAMAIQPVLETLAVTVIQPVLGPLDHTLILERRLLQATTDILPAPAQRAVMAILVAQLLLAHTLIPSDTNDSTEFLQQRPLMDLI